MSDLSSLQDIGVDLDVGAAFAAAAFSGVNVNGDEYVRCMRCGFGGCDLRVSGCGCTLHARCMPLVTSGGGGASASLSKCPVCARPASSLVLFPMCFREMDEARKMASQNWQIIGHNQENANGIHGRKRTNSCISSATASVDGAFTGEKDSRTAAAVAAVPAICDSSERRTGRWTDQELAYCDALISKFTSGQLSLVDGTKLNDFLANMLKSKQSRLTKKMKNAKLSTKTFVCTTGHISDVHEARHFSDLEESFFRAVPDPIERAEIKFHIQREWREHFSSFCMKSGLNLDADDWLSSIEEMDRRVLIAKDAARMARRKVMLGCALRQDTRNIDQGVFIELTEDDQAAAAGTVESTPAQGHQRMSSEEFVSLLRDQAIFTKESCESPEETISAEGGTNDSSLPSLTTPSTSASSTELNGKASLLHTGPFITKLVAYMQRHGVPFEHIDVWVPSFVTIKDNDGSSSPGTLTTCRLCYAGSATTAVEIGADGRAPGKPLSPEDQFNLLAFGDYSQKFSFDIGCGLPGRVYQTGVPTWEQSVHNAPHQHFERCGGALQWGIRTVVGLPIPSPNVGRIVVTLYSRHDRLKDQELVGRLCSEFASLSPSPRWKLVVDIGASSPTAASAAASLAGTREEGEASPTPPGQDTGGTPISSAMPSDKEQTRRAQTQEVIAILGEHMPSDQSSSPLGPYLEGFMSLRLLLLRSSSRTIEEEQLIDTILNSFSSYSGGGRSRRDTALMLARDFMFLTKQQGQSQPPPMQTPQLQQQSGQMLQSPGGSHQTSFLQPGVRPSSSNRSLASSGGSTTDVVSIVSKE